MLPAVNNSQDSAFALDTSLKSTGANAHSGLLGPRAARRLILHSDPGQVTTPPGAILSYVVGW